MTSLNPLKKIGKQIQESIEHHQGLKGEEAKKAAIEMLGKVGIPDPERRYEQYPHEFSGGMRQRVVIAIAAACRPQILICDEPTTALDVTIQAQILQLIRDLQKELGMSVIYITHDLGVVANVADRVAVMYAGQIVEYGTVEEIFYDAWHPYTWALLQALPQRGHRRVTALAQAVDSVPPPNRRYERDSKGSTATFRRPDKQRQSRSVQRSYLFDERTDLPVPFPTVRSDRPTDRRRRTYVVGPPSTVQLRDVRPRPSTYQP